MPGKKKGEVNNVERREGTADCKVDRKLAELTTLLTAALVTLAK